MDNIEYTVVIHTPQRCIIGRLSAIGDQSGICGNIYIDQAVCPYQASMDDNGNLKVTTTLSALGNTFSCMGTGKISYHAIHITLVSGDTVFELDGTSR